MKTKLSDAEYLSILHSISNIVSSRHFLPVRVAEHEPAQIISNCGMCSPRFQHESKIPVDCLRAPEQRCPFDTRVSSKEQPVDYSFGCYNFCVLFKTRECYLPRLVPRLVAMAEHTLKAQKTRIERGHHAFS